MESRGLIQCGNTLKVTLVNYSSSEYKESPNYVIGGSVIFQLKCKIKSKLLVRICKLRQEDPLTYVTQVTSWILKFDKTLVSNDGTWQLLHKNVYPPSFYITVTVDAVPGATSFAPLHEDLDLIDFELRGEDGSVHVHRAVLAVSSPVWRTMFSGTWRESTEGFVEVPGTSKMTLQHLKDYLYLHTLPETGLEQLLLLASYYMMPELEHKCLFKLANTLSADNVYGLLEFISKHKNARLFIKILERFQHEKTTVNEMHDHFLIKK